MHLYIISLSLSPSQRHQTEHMFGKDMGTDAFHSDVVKSCLTRNIGALFDHMRDEADTAIRDLIIVPREGDWVKIRAKPAMQTLISRMNNRAFIGLPLCTLAEALALTILTFRFLR